MPSTVAERLFRLDTQLDRATDVLGQAFADGAAIQVNRWSRAAARFLKDLPQKDGRLLVRGGRQARKLEFALEDGSPAFPKFVLRALDQFADVSRFTFQTLKLTGHEPDLTPQARAALNSYRQLKYTEINALRESLFARASAATRKAVASGQDAGELLIEIREILDEFPWRARALYESAIGEFSQVVTAIAAGASGARAYLYTGPIDGRIRPFCARLVGRVLTRAAIDRLDNGQLPNSFLTRGGYNCRHQWRDVTPIPELARLANTATVVAPAKALLASVGRGPRLRGRPS